jgi:hypothetical protein
VEHVRCVWLKVIREPSVESVWRVGRVFPYSVYIEVCTLIRIDVTLEYEYRFFVVVIT